MYKSVITGPFKKSLVNTSIVKFIMLILDSFSTWFIKVKTSVSILNLTILVATCDFLNTLMITDLKNFYGIGFSSCFWHPGLQFAIAFTHSCQSWTL